MERGKGLHKRILMLSTVMLASGYAGQSIAEELIIVNEEKVLRTGRKNGATKTYADERVTPQSLSLISREQMEKRGAQTLAQALRYTNVQAEDRGRATSMEAFSNRGFALDRYLDGLKLPQIGVYAAPQVDTWLLEEATVIGGPSSVLYGQASPGGIVNMESKRPDPTAAQQLVVRAGNNQRMQASFDLGGVTDDEALLWRMAGNGYKADTQVRYTEERRYALAPSLTWQPNASTSLTLLASWLHDPDNYHDVVPAAGSALPNPNGRIPDDFFAGEPDFNRYDRQQWGIGWMLEHHLNDAISLRQNARYMHSDFSMSAVMAGGLAPNYRTLSRYSFINHTRGEGVTVDNQLDWLVRGEVLEHQVLTGFDVQWTQADIRQGFGGAAPMKDIFHPKYGAPVRQPAFSSRNQQTQEQYGLYVQDTLSWQDVTLLAGLRQDWTKGRNENLLTGVAQKQSDRELSGRLGGVWQVTETLAPWASYSTAFQPTSGVDYHNSAFKPRTAEQYEAGLRWLPEERTTLSLAVFEIIQENVLVDDPAHRRYKIQTGKIRSRGVEASLQSEPLAGLSLTANWRYGEAEVREDSNQALIGKTPAGFARNSASLWSDYRVQHGPAAGLGVGAGVRYTGRSPGNANNTFSVASHTLFDAMISWRFSDASLKGLQLSLNANNLLDKRYTASCGGDVRSSWCFPGLERTLLVSAQYQW